MYAKQQDRITISTAIRREYALTNKKTKGLTPAISSKTKNQLLCYYGNCRNLAWTEFSLTGFGAAKQIKGKAEVREMLVYVFCCPEHQAAQLLDWKEM